MKNPGSLLGADFSGLDELWSRIKFLLMAIFVYRVGTHIPVPGIDPSLVADLFSRNEGTYIDLFNVFSGGALERMSILSLGIMPYISASIIMQLMSSVVPSLEQLRKEGDSGRRKISQYTRYLTLVLAMIQATAMTKGLNLGYDIDAESSWLSGFFISFVMIVSLVCGSMFMMWLGEQITENGIGNGISMLIFAGIVAGLPSALGQALEGAQQGDISVILLLFILFLLISVIWFIILVERGQRKIKVNYAKRQHGNKVVSAQSSHLPLKINMAGVIPAIFASSILLFPQSIATWFASGDGFFSGILLKMAASLGPGQPLYSIAFVFFIVFFCFFYTALMYNPSDVADNLKKSGAYITGIRPGEHTSRYIDKILTRLTVIGSLYMSAVCLMPQFLIIFADIPFYLGGTSLLIVVVVLMDFMAQVQSHLMSKKYDSLMKKSNLRAEK